MTDTTVHQARTTLKGWSEQHLMIEDRIAKALTVFNVRHGEETSTTIYLSKEQWAELAVVAQKMADESPETKDPEDYLTNEQVLEGQRLARLQHVKRVARGIYSALLQGSLTLPYATVGTYGVRALDLLIELNLAEIIDGKVKRVQALNRDRLAALRAIDAAAGHE